MQLILLPGMDGTGFLFEPLLQVLGDGYSASEISYPCSTLRTYEELERLVFYLQGRRDRVVGAHNLRRIRALNPRVMVREVDAPHLLLQVAPRESARHIGAFVAQSAAPP